MNNREQLLVTVDMTRDEAEMAVVRSEMRAETARHAAVEDYAPITVVLRNVEGVFLGAALGETGRGWLSISVIWVDKSVRGKGYGRQVLETMEAEAAMRGCHSAYLDTFSYQARPFYERCGYTMFGSLDDYPTGHTRYFMQKKIVT